MAIEPKIIDNGNGLKIIDPNPPNQVVDHEDLYIYASLVAKTKGRSFITEGVAGDRSEESIALSTVDMIVSDTATKSGSKREFLTTAWSDIGGSQLDDASTRGDVEGFGITNIDIEIKGSYIPRVVIDFVDIRGATLFEQGSCSPYGMFFHLPYPIFELTLKGYYGKPATYYLNLQKFNTKFNTETGNFECKAEFIGWSYAFLADMLMGFVRCSNYMKGPWAAKEKLRNRYDEAIKYYLDNGIYDETDYVPVTDNVKIQEGRYEDVTQPFCRKVAGTSSVECKTITNLLQDISQIRTFLRQAKADESYIEVANLIRVKNEVNAMRAEVVSFTRELEKEENRGYLLGGEPKLTQAKNPDKEKTTRNIKELYVFNQAPDDKLTTIIERWWLRPVDDGSGKDKDGSGLGTLSVQIPIAKEGLVSEDLDTGTKKCGGNYIKLASNKSKNNGLTRCELIQEAPLKYQLLDFLDDTNIQFQNNMMGGGNLTYRNAGKNVHGDDYYIDVGYLTSLLDGDIVKLEEKIEEKRTAVKDGIDNGVIRILGFRPTIRNVFTILACNVENFVHILLDVCIAADKHHNSEEIQKQYNQQYNGSKEDQFMVLKNQADYDNPKEIYPWPTYYKTEYVSITAANPDKKKETKEVYPGTNTEFNTWPEVRFVEDFIEACDRLNEADEELLEDKEGRPGYDNYMPLNPLESQLYGEVQLKYREILKHDLDTTALEEAIRKIIAERMFMTLDFSYFDPIRYNEFNLGLGFNYPWRQADDIDGTPVSWDRFQEKRIWFNTLYPNMNEKESNKNPLTTLAKIDAHNLLSCITDEDKLTKLDLSIFNNDLFDNIENDLNRLAEGRTEPTSNPDELWFNPNAKYTDLSENMTTPNILKDNVDYIKNYSKTDDYWAYYPPKGYIRLLGHGSQPYGYGDDDGLNTMELHCDIRRMEKEFLFQLIEGKDFDDKIANGITLDYSGDLAEKRGDLEKDFGDAIKYTAGLFNDATGTEMGAYTVDDTKLIMFDGGEDKGLRLFTTLGIAPESGKSYSKFDIEFSGIPLYPTSDDASKTSRLAPGWGSIKQGLWPFSQHTYMFLGDYKDDGEARGADYANWTDGSTQDAVYPSGVIMEPPGTGMLSGVPMTNPLKGHDDDEDIPAFVNTNPNPKNMRDISSGFLDIDKYNWGWIQEFNNLIQLPLWLDNVNRFREATVTSGWRDRSGSSAIRTTNKDLGYRRPLTSSGTNYYGLEGPKLDKVKSMYGGTTKIFDGGTNGNDKYTKEQIESRNLAYLFLSGCKTTPLITCGSAEASKNTGKGLFGWNPVDDPGDGVYNYRGDHYPKALRPFITSQGIVKIPKIWVYGMGAVMWRWKMYMGANRDEAGNIRWRHPAFSETPTGIDPLAQPGHPGVACESRQATPINGYMLGNSLYNGRRNRSRTQDGNTTSSSGGVVASVTTATGDPAVLTTHDLSESFANKVFKTEKGLWSTPISQQLHTQISCFSRGVTRVDGMTRAIYAGSSSSNKVKFNGTTNPDVVDGWQDTCTYGCMFDYYGVYNSDNKLMSSRPQGWFPNRSMSFSDDADDSHQGPWTSLWFQYARTDSCCGLQLYNGAGQDAHLIRLAIQGLDNVWPETNSPLQLQMHGAKEAASNSFWPILWCAPWQHFYTEPVSVNGKVGMQKVDTVGNKFVEQTMILPLYDTIFRDYVGNFGYLGDNNNNYSSRRLGATQDTIVINDLPKSFIFPDKRPLPMTEVTDAYTIQIVTTTIPNQRGKSALLSFEGGKYAELMALLPTFIKEKFVKEFEKWCDEDWRKSYLGVVDPVNFTSNGEKRDGDSQGNAESGLLGKSYRYNQFRNADVMDKLWGSENTTEFTTPEGVDEFFYAVPTLKKQQDKGEPDNAGKVTDLEESLINEFYYAVIPTPRVFGLDVWNGDKSKKVNGRSKNAFYANKNLAKTYLEAFKAEWKKEFVTKRKELTHDPSLNDATVLNDDDIKLSLYRSFKSISDKWISSSTNVKSNTPSYFFNITDIDESMGTDHVPLAGHFSYVNRVMQEIGNKSVLDVLRLDKIPDNPKMSFYNLISDLLGENNFDFFPLPTYTNFTADKSDENLKSMFRPDTNLIKKQAGPNFICMYVGGTSRTVDLKTKGSQSNCPTDRDMSFEDDGFSMSDGKKNSFPRPYEIQNSEEDVIIERRKEVKDATGNDNQQTPDRIEGQGFTAFRVAYGIENQNMFKSVELDQSEFSETNESLLVIDRIANGGNPGDKTQKGQNLHNVYLTRSYTCSVESMGNMMIQPLQYFELTNIPMFYGTYLITEVKHNVKPHHIGTTFKGVRQPIATVPIVEDISTAMNLSMAGLDPLSGGVNVLGGGSGSGGGTYTGSLNLPTTPTKNINGVDYFDIGATDKSQYYNHKWKECKKCDKSSGGHILTKYDGTISWVAYNQPTSSLNASNIEYIVLHWSGGYQKIENSKTLASRGLHYHYEINKDGGLWKLSDTTKTAFHGGDFNQYSIGISYVGGVEDNTAGSVYVRTIDNWNTEDLNLNGRDTYKAKKQFAAIIEAIVLAVAEYPTIKYITSHHWFKGSKSDVGNKFPWDILISELKTKGVNLTVKYEGTSPGKVKWVGESPESVTGNIDLSNIQNAQEQELAGNANITYSALPLGIGVNVQDNLTPSNYVQVPIGLQNSINSAGYL